MPTLQRIYCATTNPGKLAEFQLGGLRAGFDVQSLPGLRGIEPPEETGLIFSENAALKARHYSLFAPEPDFADAEREELIRAVRAVSGTTAVTVAIEENAEEW